MAMAVALVLVGCGTNRATTSEPSLAATEPSYVSEPFTHEQQLVEQGARLVVTDGCSACHLSPAGHRIAPSFASFAGHRVTLTDGRRVVVNERFVREALEHPGLTTIKGYDPSLMLEALRRRHLPSHPQQIEALAAFIEQIGPEPG
jgi:cytochrome c5